MASSRPFALSSLAIAAVLTAGGCSTTQLDEERALAAPIATATPTPATPQAAPESRAVKRVDVPSQALDPFNDARSILAKRSVYFDFDEAEIKREFVPLITAHGEYLGMHHKRRVVIEGNADERGSREYNLALGQLRADALKLRLVLLGMRDDQAETISFGEERPRAPGHDEASWAQNRRVDIVYR